MLGRPTIYDEDMLARARGYLETCVDGYEVMTRPEIKDGAVIDRLHVEYHVKLPSIEGMAAYLGIHKDTIYDWETKHPEFSDVIALLRSQQADKLLNKGLSGQYNSTIAKVLLTKHGYREGIENTGDNGGAIKVDITEQLKKAYGDTGPSDEVPDGG